MAKDHVSPVPCGDNCPSCGTSLDSYKVGDETTLHNEIDNLNHKAKVITNDSAEIAFEIIDGPYATEKVHFMKKATIN